MTNTKYKLPCRVTHNNQILVPGKRDMGWSVMDCDDRTHALQIMAAYPTARMPCWQRIERGEV